MNFTYIPQKTDGLLKSLALNDLKYRCVRVIHFFCLWETDTRECMNKNILIIFSS